MNENIKLQRDTKYELLRIIAIIMIILHHFCVHGVILSKITSPIQINNLLILILNSGGKIGVDIFILISGYFLIESTFKLSKWLTLYIKTIFYSVLCYAAICAFGIAKFSIHDLYNNSIFILGHNVYWFISAYLILYLFVPYINKLIKEISQKDFQKLLLMMLIIWCFLPTIIPSVNYSYSTIGWFVFMYMVGAYVRLYKPTVRKEYFITSIGICIITCFCYFLHIISQNHIKLTKGILPMNNISEFIIALGIFFLFRNINIKYNKFINFISTSVLCVYLIHDNPYIRNALWHQLIDCKYIISKPYGILLIIAISIAVFVSCTVMDKVAYYIYNPMIKFITNKIEKTKLH